MPFSCSDLPCVILAGGFGSRLGDITESIPKPMVEIGGKPILWHIISHYMSFGVTNFILALGYKSAYIKRYFMDFQCLSSDFTLDLANGQIDLLGETIRHPKITFVDTGIATSTGTRLAHLKTFLKPHKSFMLTYGDGVSNVNLDSLYEFHRSHGCSATVTAVRPPARFGELVLDGESVIGFNEKPSISSGRINGGFFVFNQSFFDYIPPSNVMLEREPIQQAIKSHDLMAFKHDGFWQCMDTKRDLECLTRLYEKHGARFW